MAGEVEAAANAGALGVWVRLGAIVVALLVPTVLECWRVRRDCNEKAARDDVARGFLYPTVQERNHDPKGSAKKIGLFGPGRRLSACVASSLPAPRQWLRDWSAVSHLAPWRLCAFGADRARVRVLFSKRPLYRAGHGF